MVNVYMKKRIMSLKYNLITTMNYSLGIRITIIKKTRERKFWKGCRDKRTFTYGQ